MFSLSKHLSLPLSLGYQDSFLLLFFLSTLFQSPLWIPLSLYISWMVGVIQHLSWGFFHSPATLSSQAIYLFQWAPICKQLPTQTLQSRFLFWVLGSYVQALTGHLHFHTFLNVSSLIFPFPYPHPLYIIGHHFMLVLSLKQFLNQSMAFHFPWPAVSKLWPADQIWPTACFCE